MNNYFKKLKSEKNFLFWNILFLISLCSLILMISSDFYCSIPKLRAKEPWKEHLILFFYFTFLSNVIAFITSLLVIIFKGDINSIHLKRLKILMIVSLTITFIVYWTILARTSIMYISLYKLISTIFVHALTPLFAIFAFIYESKVKKFKEKLPFKSTFLWISFFPFFWVIMCVIMYYSLGAHSGDGIYGFLDFQQHPWWLPIVALVGITFLFVGLTVLYVWINNLSIKNKKQIKT